MNMVVVDITDEDPRNKVQLDDDVVLVGKQGKQQITWDEFASRNKMGIVEQVLLIGNQNTRKVISH
jgi:alanine racemase